jgi:hypothetical protein
MAAPLDRERIGRTDDELILLGEQTTRQE